MFPDVTVTAVAAPLAVVSALFALVFVLYGIPRAARNEPGLVWISVVLSIGNVGLVWGFLWFVAQRVAHGIDPALFTNPFSNPQPYPTQPIQGPHYAYDPPMGPGSSEAVVQMMWFALFGALTWYAMSIGVFIAEIRAGRPRGQRASSPSE